VPFPRFVVGVFQPPHDDDGREDLDELPTRLVDERTMEDCYTFLPDLRERLLPAQRIQLSTDGFGVYPSVVDALWRGEHRLRLIEKEYGDTPTASRAAELQR